MKRLYWLSSVVVAMSSGCSKLQPPETEKAPAIPLSTEQLLNSIAPTPAPTVPIAVPRSVASSVRTWPRFTSARGFYSVEMPELPPETDISRETLQGFEAKTEYREANHWSEFTSTAFLLDPRSVYLSLSPVERLERAAQVFGRGTGKSYTSQQLQVDGHAALDTVMNTPPPKSFHIAIRYIAVDDRIYKLQVLATPGALREGYPTRFFDSFRLEPKPVTPSGNIDEAAPVVVR